jgi:mannose-6-phosphate isomerase-like protein (cupin superfamily)
MSGEQVIYVPPGAGRAYQAGPMRAVFKADGTETEDRYCVSEWWLESGDPGPGAHAHDDNVEIFYVIEGTMSFLAGEKWLDAPRGSFLRIPAGVKHDFENRSGERAGVLNVFIPGGFEVMMPAIVNYFAELGAADPSHR